MIVIIPPKIATKLNGIKYLLLIDLNFHNTLQYWYKNNNNRVLLIKALRTRTKNKHTIIMS